MKINTQYKIHHNDLFYNFLSFIWFVTLHMQMQVIGFITINLDCYYKLLLFYTIFAITGNKVAPDQILDGEEQNKTFNFN